MITSLSRRATMRDARHSPKIQPVFSKGCNG
jgi:hypothetical protein